MNTTIEATVLPPITGPTYGPTLTRVVRSEWTKLWSLRSTRWTLAIAFVAQAGLGPLIAFIMMDRWSHLSVADRLTLNPIDLGLGGWHLAVLPVAVMGVMTISGEYGTGSIRASLMAVPKRVPLLSAKLIVFMAVTCALMLVAAVIGFLGAQSIFTAHDVNVTLGAPHALRALIGAALATTITGGFCLALGTLVRRTAGGIALYVAIFFVLPGLIQILPSDTANGINPFLPSNAVAVIGQASHSAHTFSPWGGFALFCGYTLALSVIAAIALRYRDA